MSEMLLIDCCNNTGVELCLNESTSRRGLVKFRGKFQEADTVNRNKRMYPFHVLDENVKRLQEALKNRTLLGELDHPSDTIIHYANASHVITKLWWEGKALMGEGEILNTPSGKVLKTLIEDGIRIGISSRGVGSGTTNEEGILVVNESYKLITFDAVADPSTYAAFQRKVSEHNQPVSQPVVQNYQGETNYQEKNKQKNIHTFEGKLSECLTGVLITCLDDFIREQTRKYKSRLR